jgi:hypothetical protein
VIYNRLHARMPLGIDATLRYGSTSADRVDPQVAAREPDPVQPRLHRPAADADRQPGLASIQAARTRRR